MGGRIALFCMRHRRLVFGALIALVAVTAALIPRITVDTDPENMLAVDQPDRLLHNEIKRRFDLSDMIVVGMVSSDDPDGIYNPDSLAALHALTRAVEGIDGVVARDVLSLATIDNVEQVAPGTISFERMMERPPATREEARAIRAAVERLPMSHGTIVSGDGRAAGIYVPIVDKGESYRIAAEIRMAVDGLGSGDDFHITGQPVAQDTFGVEMFRQMAISAPLAGLVIFLLMLWFFRSVALVLAPMALAMATVIVTMGLLIGAGFTVHIMSSMIPIFLMPIAVVASVHVLSTFADRFRSGDDPQVVMAGVMETLFKPVLFTALTSAVGFASLLLTPIPPVQVFGLFVSVGVLFATLLTLTFIPAWTAALAPATIEGMVGRIHGHEPEGATGCRLCAAVEAVGRFAAVRARPLLIFFLVLMVAAVAGIARIEVNDNPTRWFKQSHDIRVADTVLNDHFAGTYEAYIVLEREGETDIGQALAELAAPVIGRQPAVADGWHRLLDEARSDDPVATLDTLIFALEDVIFEVPPAQAPAWEELLGAVERLHSGARYFQEPEALAWMVRLQDHLEEGGSVGKSNSLADLVRTVYRELVSGDDRDYRIPESSAGVAQAIMSFQSSYRPHDLWHFVTNDYRAASIWLQLPSGDNRDMQRVVDAVAAFTAVDPPPEGIELKWGGSTYINLVWQGEMVVGMLVSLLAAFVVVLVMMVLLFRSVVFGVLAVLPLTLTIALIYGVMGFVGKYYDMPVAVLSSLSLGLSVDFAIHFIQRLRVALEEMGDWRAALAYVFTEPARAITRNAVVIGAGFLPLLAAPLVPYMTVGIFMASIMFASTVVTLLMLPSILNTGPRLFFGPPAQE